MRSKKLLATILITVFLAGFISSCGPSKEEIKMMAEIKQLLWDRFINPSSLKKDGDDMVITYEVSNAIDYRAQPAAEWGTIFGILQWYAKDDVHIILTIDGKPVAKVKADVDNIRKFSRGKMSREAFFNKITISVIS